MFTVLLEDVAALSGLLAALAGISAAHLLGLDWADGAASVVIGLILASVAAFLAIEIKSLLIGEAASPEVQRSIRNEIMAESGTVGPVRAINEIRTMQLGPHDMIVAASVDMYDHATARDVEATNARLDAAIKAKHPDVRFLFIEVEAAKADAPSTRAAVAINAAAMSVTAAAAPEPSAPKPVIQSRPPSAKKGKGKKRRH
jgi:divalent metal cation (Fe/Co/Zn/Cd) transporter